MVVTSSICRNADQGLKEGLLFWVEPHHWLWGFNTAEWVVIAMFDRCSLGPSPPAKDAHRYHIAADPAGRELQLVKETCIETKRVWKEVTKERTPSASPSGASPSQRTLGIKIKVNNLRLAGSYLKSNPVIRATGLVPLFGSPTLKGGRTSSIPLEIRKAVFDGGRPHLCHLAQPAGALLSFHIRCK